MVFHFRPITPGLSFQFNDLDFCLLNELKWHKNKNEK